MISVQDLEIRVGARLLMENVSFQVNKGDRVGLVGRNGAGKTTLTRTIAGDLQPANGTIDTRGQIGFLPQDTQVSDPTQTVLARILSARGLDEIHRRLAKAEHEMADMSISADRREKALNRYSRLSNELEIQGGYAAEADAKQLAANLGIPNSLLENELGTLSGGQRRRVELTRILFSQAETLILDEPTNHLDADSVSWLRDFLMTYPGGMVIISHDVALVEQVVNKVFYLDANRHVIDIYNMGWKNYLTKREDDEKRRRRERLSAEKKAAALTTQAEKMKAKATKAVAAQNMLRRAERLLDGVEEDHQRDKVAKLRFPSPAPCGRTPLKADGLSKSYGSLEIFTGADLAIDRGSRVVVLGLNGAGKTTLLRLLAGVETPDSGEVIAGHGLRLGYYAQEHETLDGDRTVLDNMQRAAGDMAEVEVRKILGSFLFTGDDVHKPARVLSGGEKTRLALATLVVSSANVLLLDEPTNNLDPASREEILGALHAFEGAIVLVSHDPGAVRALNPERVLVMPDATEDLWGPDYEELIELA
ncbi:MULTISPECIES: ABC-F family ATP-binding cassette domain-containing protein [Helcobacillus]|uniref:ATPase subunit of ABC transporter with duplicated ATPase domains n=1 Tax=Helcobacillus massiliensis TaxID=521392 RepID=A0A839QU69_9MICO|nr:MULTISPECIES: ABC-F family ATP-binding cassette domain-containing protein [Helcobacillus]MBB3022320.1 ATPase subunit of ABC transporter with duplicated ATPase domains [Helcobacillus massiliensis]MCG7426460.1 ATP-binding cassette domain-containing protein [Helcobacillus sp. ACRRO]MDK7741029.1 ABC-F family ATP-binding cassette domain-containing protein [Helcobacillus massiliensis]WOO93841.1 ABC-F family ATP-binding cassette domain-containing protein [Helcobacillus massiliensis]